MQIYEKGHLISSYWFTHNVWIIRVSEKVTFYNGPYKIPWELTMWTDVTNPTYVLGITLCCKYTETCKGN